MSAPFVVSVADRAGFHIFASALRSSDHADLLAGAGPFTVFAPADAAFEKLPSGKRNRLLTGDRDLLNAVLGYHFAPGRVGMAHLVGKRIRAIMHTSGSIVIDGRSELRVNGARLDNPDIGAGNGVVHGIDAVLWPPTIAALAKAS
jgi:uncharacterized surface protein with fasciclin (FAS1) repeats